MIPSIRLTSTVAALLALAAPAALAAEGDPVPTPVPAPAVEPAPAPAPPDAGDAELRRRVDELDQQVRIVSRQLELAQEESDKKAKEGVKTKAATDGFSLASADGSFSLRLGGYVQADGRFYLTDDDRPQADTFLIRRARPILEVKLGKHVAGRIMTDFGGGTATVQDAYIDLILVPQLALRTGKFKPPVGLERLQSGSALVFIERGLPTNLVPNRDVGAQLFGSFADGVLEYQVGVFNGAVDGSSRDGDVNDDKEGAARIWAVPFKASGEEWIDGLGVGIAGSYGQEDGSIAGTLAVVTSNLPSYRSSGQDVIFRYAQGAAPTLANTAIASGDHWRLTPQLHWSLGQLGLLGEYVISAQQATIGATTDTLTHRAWQGVVSYVLTGERSSFRGVQPRHAFSLENGTWGAWELAARIQGLSIDDDAFTRGFAARNQSVSEAIGYGAGLNWYLSRNLKWQLNWELTQFTDGAGTAPAPRDRQDEQVAFTRFQVAF